MSDKRFIGNSFLSTSCEFLLQLTSSQWHHLHFEDSQSVSQWVRYSTQQYSLTTHRVWNHNATY